MIFIKETLFALLLMVSIIVPPIYLGYQVTPEFRKKRYINVTINDLFVLSLPRVTVKNQFPFIPYF